MERLVNLMGLWGQISLPALHVNVYYPLGLLYVPPNRWLEGRLKDEDNQGLLGTNQRDKIVFPLFHLFA